MTALSPTHEMIGKIERSFDAHFLNRVANHPKVQRWIKGYEKVPLDLTAAVDDRNNIQLVGEHGVMVFHFLQPGLYECHTLVMPEGRGEWTLRFVNACLFIMFTQTDCMEIMTKVPKGNVRALALVKAIHGVYDFTSPQGWVMDNDPVPADIYTMHAQDWVRFADGLPERGAWFHSRLQEEFARFGKTEPVHPHDDWHDRHVGAAAEMILGGVPGKGLVFYNRFAKASGCYAPMEYVGQAQDGALVLNIASALLCVRNKNFTVTSCLF